MHLNNRLTEKLQQVLCRDRKRFVVAASLACILLVVDYIGGNLSYPVFDGSYSLSGAAYMAKLWSRESDEVPFLAVNVAYDREMVIVYDEFDDTLGQTQVVDRRLLNHFLQTIADADYKYILLDVRFEPGYKSDGDSALFATLTKLPRLILAVHRSDGPESESLVADERLLPLAAYADYRSLAHSGFTRYEFLQDKHESMALRMYRDLDNGRINGFGPLYFDGWRLCRNMHFVEMPADAGARHKDNYELAFPYMGAHLLRLYTPDELRNLVKGKIIIIGDFDADIHDSYVGPVPGPLIHYYAYRALKNGRHIYGVLSALIIWLVYFGIAFVLLKGLSMPLKQLKSNNSRLRQPWKRLLIALVVFSGWNGVLIVLRLLLFWICGLSLSLALPRIAFTAIQLVRVLKAVLSDGSRNAA